MLCEEAGGPDCLCGCESGPELVSKLSLSERRSESFGRTLANSWAGGEPSPPTRRQKSPFVGSCLKWLSVDALAGFLSFHKAYCRPRASSRLLSLPFRRLAVP